MQAKSKAKAPSISSEEQMRLDYYLYAALNASEHNAHAQAFFLLELCHEIDPTNPTVCSMRGGYFASLYGKEKALPLLRKAYEGAPDDYWYRYVVTAYENGNRSEAMKVLKTMRKRNPKDLDVLELSEQIYMHEGKVKDALGIRDAIDRLTGEPTEQSVVTRFHILGEAGRTAEAMRVLDTYLERDPHNSRIQAIRLEEMYRAAIQSGDKQKAAGLLQQIMLNADIPLPHKITHIERSKDYLGYGASEQIEMLNDLRDRYPYEQQVYQAMLDLQKNQLHDYHAALEIGRTMLTMNPTDSSLREQIAELMRQVPDITQAELAAYFEECYAALPDAPQWGYYKAILLVQDKAYDTACTVLSHALEHAEEPLMRMKIIMLYTESLLQIERYDEAYPLFDEALKLTPDNLSILNNYAWAIAIGGGDMKKAESMSQRTIQKEANNPTYLDTYAWILHLQGQDTLALFYIRKAMEYADDKTDKTIIEHANAIQQHITTKAENKQ